MIVMGNRSVVVRLEGKGVPVYFYYGGKGIRQYSQSLLIYFTDHIIDRVLYWNHLVLQNNKFRKNTGTRLKSYILNRSVYYNNKL